MYEPDRYTALELIRLIRTLERERDAATELAEKLLPLVTAADAWSSPNYAGQREAYGASRARAELSDRVARELARVLADRAHMGRRSSADR